MNTVFFKQICSKADDVGTDWETSIFLHLDACVCEGLDFGGMPSMSLGLDTNGYNTDFFYVLDPIDFELYPKIDDILQEQYCNNGFWSLADTFPN